MASVVQVSLGKGLQVIFDTNPSTRYYENSQFGKAVLMKFQILRTDLKGFVCLSRENSYFTETF